MNVRSNAFCLFDKTRFLTGSFIQLLGYDDGFGSSEGGWNALELKAVEEGSFFVREDDTSL